MRTKMNKANFVRKVASVLFAFLMVGGGNSFASDPIPLSVEIYDPYPTSPGHGKSPVFIPSVLLDDYHLYFQGAHSDYTLTLLDNEDNVVYSTLVYSTDTEVILPSTLSGEYQILLVPDNTNYYFVGTIVL